jgi:hypothetical protein
LFRKDVPRARRAFLKPFVLVLRPDYSKAMVRQKFGSTYISAVANADLRFNPVSQFTREKKPLAAKAIFGEPRVKRSLGLKTTARNYEIGIERSRQSVLQLAAPALEICGEPNFYVLIEAEHIDGGPSRSGIRPWLRYRRHHLRLG